MSKVDDIDKQEKILDPLYQELRNDALQNPENYTDDELEELDLTRRECYRKDPDPFLVDIDPLEQSGVEETREVDLREKLPTRFARIK